VQEPSTDAPAFIVGKHGHDPKLAGVAVADGEAGDFAVFFRQPSAMRGAKQRGGRFFSNAEITKNLARERIFARGGADVEDFGKVGWLD